MSDSTRQHAERIVEQFTRQAAPFAAHPAHTDAAAMAILHQVAGWRPTDTVLDVACGPGLVACAVAPHVARVTGLDVTPAMLAQARQRQADLGLTNLTWQVGDGQTLPFPDRAFTRCVCRYAFHHLLEPAAVFQEMVRVTVPGGRVLVIDVVPAPEKRAAYDRIEKWRDPSHTRALTLPELMAMGRSLGLADPVVHTYGLETDLAELVAASFPDPADRERLWAAFRADAANGADTHGFAIRANGDRFTIRFPVALAAWAI
ncbi:MAG TPA: methyltransferase domain-containing protein [Verrucomicrobiae bacterium]